MWDTLYPMTDAAARLLRAIGQHAGKGGKDPVLVLDAAKEAGLDGTLAIGAKDELIDAGMLYSVPGGVLLTPEGRKRCGFLA
jgi:hypothetical protein